MIRIDELAILLPEDFEHRADRISRLTCERIKSLTSEKSFKIGSLILPEIEITDNDTDDLIADNIFQSLKTDLENRS